MAEPSGGREMTAAICKNPFCMRIFTVPSIEIPKGAARIKLRCPGCKHEDDYQKEDFHRASGPEGTALNPV